MATPRLGEIAPDFHADTTEGPIAFHDWKHDSWAVLFSHPADFTPVCTTELGRVAALKDDWAARGVKVLAVSVDPLQTHDAWKGDIEQVGGAAVTYPLIADDSRQVSELYDMIHPGEGDTSGVRSVFVIDPANKVRLNLTYPKSVGRNFDEILRAVDALQLTDRGPFSTPADWKDGERVIVAPSLSTADARARFGAHAVEEVTPYLRYTTESAKPEATVG
ncbi:MAG: peroxiredoxin [Terracoccus sp.]